MIIKKMIIATLFVVICVLPFVAVYKSQQTYKKISFIDTNLANARSSVDKEIVKKNLNAVLVGIEETGLMGNISIFSSDSDGIEFIKAEFNSVLKALSENESDSVSLEIQQQIQSLPETIALRYSVWRVGASFVLFFCFFVTLRIFLVFSIKEDEQTLNSPLLGDLPHKGRFGYEE